MRTLAWALFLIAGVALAGVAWQSGTARKTPVQSVQTPSTASKRLDAYQQVCKIAGGCQNVKVTLAPVDIPGPGPAIIGVTVETAHVAGTSVYSADETGYTVSTSEGSGGREIAHVKTRRGAENIAVNIAAIAWLAEYHHTGEVDWSKYVQPIAVEHQSVIRISAENLLAEFQRSEANKEVRIRSESLSKYLNDNTETAEARYKGKRIEVTGIVTGVFIPSIETSRRILENRGKGIFDEQGGTGSFITMGGPYPHSAEETLLLPGINAWSKTGDSQQPTFGQPNIESLAGQLVVGKQASILCTFRSSSGSSPTEVSISLEDCILEPTPPLPTPTVPAPVAAQSFEKSIQSSKADVLIQQKRYSEALPLLDQGCTAGNGEECKDLGMIYANGFGFAQDLPRAVELFSKSCDEGNARGCFDLGTSYKSGRGVKQDNTHAVALFSQSCNGGDAKGCEALGLMYDLGIGVARDALHAVTLYSKACNGGDAAGCDHIKENTNNLEADAHLDKVMRTLIAMHKYRAHPADLDSSFTAPRIDTVDDNKISDKTPLKGISGQVVLACMIEPSGTCRHWEVLKSVNPEEDQAVIGGLSGIHFVPATEYGHPITYPFFQAVTLNFGPGKQSSRKR